MIRFLAIFYLILLTKYISSFIIVLSLLLSFYDDYTLYIIFFHIQLFE